MAAQSGFDLAQLDTVTADLHLLVHAPKELKYSVREPANEIPGPIKPRAFTERIGHEFFRRDFRAIQVSSGQPISAGIKLTGHANGHGLRALIEDEYLRISDRPADGNGMPCDARFINLVAAGKRCVFGGAVSVDKAAIGQFGQRSFDMGNRQDVSTR